MYIIIAAAVTIILAASNVCWLIAYMRLLSNQLELSKLLASKNFTEYSIGEARLAEKRREQKDAEGYESVLQEVS